MEPRTKDNINWRLVGKTYREFLKFADFANGDEPLHEIVRVIK